MSLPYADNLEIKMRAPNVQRDLFNTIADMASYNENYLPDMFICVNTEDGKLYLYNRNNSVDPVLGKWREFTGGAEIDLSEEEDPAYFTTVEIVPGVSENISCTQTVTQVGNKITTVLIANADSSDPSVLAAGDVISIIEEIDGIITYEYNFADSVIISPFD